MFELFSDDSRRVVELAQEECRELVDHQIRSEHLLLGLLREPGSDGESVLAAFGVAWDGVREEVLRRMPDGKPRGRDASGHIPFTPNAKRVMQHGVAEATRLGRESVTPALLLCGLLSVEGCGAVAVLRALGVDVAQLASAAERAALEREPATRGRRAPVAGMRDVVGAADQSRTVPAGLRDLADLLETVARQRDRLGHALLRYGRHDDDCAGAATCTCGLQRLLNEVLDSGGGAGGPQDG